MEENTTPSNYFQGQEPEQQQPSETERQLNNQIFQEERVTNFISQTSPTASLDKINYALQGYAYDSAEKEWKKIGEGISDEMRKDIIQFITPDLSEDTRMTNLEAGHINGIMESVIDFMAWYLYSADKDLELKELDRIFWIVIKAVFITIMRSQSGVERNRLYGSLSLGGQVNPEQSGENKNWWRFWGN